MSGFPPLWNATDIAYMRAAQLASMMEECLIERPTVTPDGNGGWTTVWNAVGVPRPCRVKIIERIVGNTGETQKWGDQENAQVGAIITLPYDQDVQIQDRIILQMSETDETRIWYVTGLASPETGMTARRVKCESKR